MGSKNSLGQFGMKQFTVGKYTVGQQVFKKIFILGLALGMIVSCQSKKKAEQAEAAPPVPEVNDQGMSYDSMGSDSGKIDGLMSINFDYDRSSLSKDAKNVLRGNAEWLNKNDKVSLQVEGHCDSRGSIEYNLSLGERRANAVKNYLVGLGVSGSRLTTISYGEEKPMMSEETESAWSKNRRANFLPMSK